MWIRNRPQVGSAAGASATAQLLAPLGGVLGLDDVVAPSLARLPALAGEDARQLLQAARARARLVGHEAAVLAGDDAGAAQAGPAQHQPPLLLAGDAAGAVGQRRAAPVAQVAGAAHAAAQAHAEAVGGFAADLAGHDRLGRRSGC